MTQSEKRLLTILSILLLILTVSVLTRTYFKTETNDSYEEISIGFHCSTDIARDTQTQDGDTVTSVKSVNHSIYTSEGSKLTDLCVTVTGSVTPAECGISHISTSLSDQQWDGLRVSELTAQDTATVILFQDQLSVCHFQYRISQNGEINFLQ